MNLTKHFSLAEFLFSQTAQRCGIKNEPSKKHIAAMRRLCETVLEPLREQLGKSVRITSGYRCQKLNAAVHGSDTSSHIKGQAADIIILGMPASDVALTIDLLGLPYDQLIVEFDRWVHVSSAYKNRGEKLIASRESGKVKYKAEKQC